METDNVLQYLTQEELVTYQEMFSIFDKEDTGTMPTSEVPIFIRGLGHCPTQTELKQIMQSLDPHDEGSVSFTAIVSVLVKRKKQANIEDDLSQALEGIQNEIDGSVSANSSSMSIYGITKMMGSIGECMSEQQIEQFNLFLEENNLKQDDKNFNFRDFCKILAYGYLE